MANCTECGCKIFNVLQEDQTCEDCEKVTINDLKYEIDTLKKIIIRLQEAVICLKSEIDTLKKGL